MFDWKLLLCLEVWVVILWAYFKERDNEKKNKTQNPKKIIRIFSFKIKNIK
jgi:hypothetical protein